MLANLAQPCLTSVVATAAAVAGDQAVHLEQVCRAAAVSTLPHAACPASHLDAAAAAGADAPVVLPQGAAADNIVQQVAVLTSAGSEPVLAVASVLAAVAAPVHAVVSVLAAGVCDYAAVAAAVHHSAAAVCHSAAVAAAAATGCGMR